MDDYVDFLGRFDKSFQVLMTHFEYLLKAILNAIVMLKDLLAKGRGER